jgi:hypothetical protein
MGWFSHAQDSLQTSIDDTRPTPRASSTVDSGHSLGLCGERESGELQEVPHGDKAGQIRPQQVADDGTPDPCCDQRLVDDGEIRSRGARYRGADGLAQKKEVLQKAI